MYSASGTTQLRAMLLKLLKNIHSLLRLLIYIDCSWDYFIYMHRLGDDPNMNSCCC